MSAKFEFDEIIIVESRSDDHAQIDGLRGTVVGKAEGDDGKWYYAVLIKETQIVWAVKEEELVSTGEIDLEHKAEVEHRSSIRVHVDPDTGGGSLDKSE